MQRNRRLRYLAILGATAALATILPGGASSHREAPLITEDPVADNTDVYAFVSPDKPDTEAAAASSGGRMGTARTGWYPTRHAPCSRLACHRARLRPGTRPRTGSSDGRAVAATSTST